ncbi:MAG: LPS assembly lipoprotein LptE [Sodalis sp. (in: enterobacteria)]
MQYRTIAIALSVAVTITSGCNYHLRGTTDQIQQAAMKNLTLKSYDPYGPITRAVHTELHLNDIALVDNPKDKYTLQPSLQIINSSESQTPVSVFQDGKTAEYQITLTVQAQILIPGKDDYPIDVKLYRSFFDNPLKALAEDSEKNIILQEMRQQAAQQLVRKLLIGQTSKNGGSSSGRKTEKTATKKIKGVSILIKQNSYEA